MKNAADLTAFAEAVDADWARRLASALREEGIAVPAPERHLASFALQQAQRRLSSSQERGLETFGIPELIQALKSLSPTAEVDFYFIHGGSHAGACFLFRGELIGCEMVRRGSAKTKPGLATE